jgi:carbonic anhydrase
MNLVPLIAFAMAVLALFLAPRAHAQADRTPEGALATLREGNTRFAEGRPLHPHADKERLDLAATSDQGAHAMATVVSCSDSRVPVEVIFDAGIMDLFIIRVAGNVCGPSEAASIEYGVTHVHTPLLLILGHSQCGAVTAACKLALAGEEAPPSLAPVLDRVLPRAARREVAAGGQPLEAAVAAQIEENVWRTLRDVFRASPDVREAVAAGKVKAAGAIYELETGRVRWLPDEPVHAILDEAD